MNSPMMRDRIKVLWVAKGLGPGGMERLLLNHATFGDRERFEYSAAYLVERPNSLRPELEALGVRCFDLSGADPYNLGWLRRLVSLVRKERFDVVHIHSPFVAALARPVLRAMPHRPKVVYTEHNSWDCYRPPTRWANRLTYGLDDARVAVSGKARESAPERLRSSTDVLVHGIDIEEVRSRRAERASVRSELELELEQLVVGIVANFRPSKAYPVLLEAARAVADADPRVVFLSVGQGPLEAEVKARHGELGLGDRFRFLGFRPDATRVMAAFDVFTLSSDVEGLPVAVMEAKALGLPVVATSVGGMPEVITDGTDGFLVPPQRPDLLAERLLEVLGDPELRARLGQASAASASRFDARVAAAELDRRYAALVA